VGRVGERISCYHIRAMKTTRANERVSGFGLVVVVMLLGIVAVVAAAVAQRTQVMLSTSQDEALQARATDTAYSGLQAGMAGIERGENDWAILGTRTSLPTRTELAYEIKVTDNLNNTDPLIDNDGTEIPPESLYLKSLAYVDNELVSGASAVVAQERGATFNYPAFGSDSIKLNNSLIEAVDVLGATVAEEGSIRTNGAQSAAIQLEGGTFVDGNATVGAGGDPVIALDVESGSGFSGDSESAGADLPLPDIAASYDPNAPDPVFFGLPIPIPTWFGGVRFWTPFGFSVVTPGDYNSLTVAPTNNLVLQPNIGGQNQTMVNFMFMAPGDYYANEFGSSGPGAIFIASGEARIHVKDNVNLAAGVSQFASNAVQDFQIYQTEDGAQVDIARTLGNMVLSTKGTLNVTDSQIQGALYGKSVEITNTTLQYPKALDGLALNDKAKGNWNIFGYRTLSPVEVDEYR
jgi:hypothetical protein